MTTPTAQELTTLLADLQRVQTESVTEIRQLRTDRDAMRQQLDTSQQQVQTQQALIAQQQVQSAALVQLGEAVKDLAEKSGKKDVPSLIDNKGLGKPTVFDNDDGHFMEWASKTANFIAGVHPQLRVVLEWASDHEQEILPGDWQDEFGGHTEDAIPNLGQLVSQL